MLIGSFGNIRDLSRYMVASLEVDLYDIRPTDKIFDALGRGGALRLHLPHTKSHVRYLAGSQTLSLLSKITNWILTVEQTRWTNAETRLNPLDYYEHGLNHQIEIHLPG